LTQNNSDIILLHSGSLNSRLSQKTRMLRFCETLETAHSITSQKTCVFLYRLCSFSSLYRLCSFSSLYLIP